MALLVDVLKDATMSFLFIFLGSTAGATVMLLTPFFGEDEVISLVLLLSVISVQLMLFGPLAEALGGASFNPTSNLANYWLGEGNESVLGIGLRTPAQLAGAVLGAFAILRVMPEKYQHTLSGPKLAAGVDMWTGMLAEGVLTFAVTLLVTWCILAGPKSFALRSACLVVGILSAIVVGAPYTGPAMNPAMAFAWAFVENTHSTREHLYVYWVAPTVGALAAAMVFGLLVQPKRKHSTEGHPIDATAVGAVEEETKEESTAGTASTEEDKKDSIQKKTD